MFRWSSIAAGEIDLRVNSKVFRPGFLTNGPRKGHYRVITDMTGVKARKISRADVADYLLKELKTGTDVGKTVFIDA